MKNSSTQEKVACSHRVGALIKLLVQQILVPVPQYYKEGPEGLVFVTQMTGLILKFFKFRLYLCDSQALPAFQTLY